MSRSAPRRENIMALRLGCVRCFTAAPESILTSLRDDVSEKSAADFEEAIAPISS